MYRWRSRVVDNKSSLLAWWCACRLFYALLEWRDCKAIDWLFGVKLIQIGSRLNLTISQMNSGGCSLYQCTSTWKVMMLIRRILLQRVQRRHYVVVGWYSVDWWLVQVLGGPVLGGLVLHYLQWLYYGRLIYGLTSWCDWRVVNANRPNIDEYSPIYVPYVVQLSATCRQRLYHWCPSVCRCLSPYTHTKL